MTIPIYCGFLLCLMKNLYKCPAENRTAVSKRPSAFVQAILTGFHNKQEVSHLRLFHLIMLFIILQFRLNRLAIKARLADKEGWIALRNLLFQHLDEPPLHPRMGFATSSPTHNGIAKKHWRHHSGSRMPRPEGTVFHELFLHFISIRQSSRQRRLLDSICSSSSLRCNENQKTMYFFAFLRLLFTFFL